MKSVFRIVFFLGLAFSLCLAAFAAEDTVYVDGVGTDANCYAKLEDAIGAVADGGTVVLTANYATPTGSAMHLPKKSFTLTAQNDAVLTLGRTFFIYGDVIFDNITVKNGAAAGVDFIYCNGYDFTVTASVDTVAKSGRYTTIFAGTSDPAKYPLVPTSSEVKLYGGDWYIVSAANYKGTFTNTVDFLIDGANVHSSFYIGNYSGTSAGTCNLTLKSGSLPTVKGTAGAYSITLNGGSVESLELDATVAPEVSKTVTITSATGTITTVAPEGYKVVQNGTEYSIEEDVVEPTAPTTVYVDGTGATEGAYATLQEAVEALHEDGGDVIVCGDTTVSGVVELAKKNGKVKITGQNGAKLTIARTFKITSEVEIDNIELVSTSGTYGYIYAQGNKLTIGENVVTSKTSGAKWLSVLGGMSSGTVEYNAHVVIKAGTYYVVYGGNNQGTFNGTATVEISNATVTGTLSARNYTGTFNGTSTIIIDLRSNKTVSAGKYKEDEIPVILVDDGYEGVLVDGTYSQQEIKEVVPVEPKTLFVDGTGKTEGAYTSIEAALADMPAAVRL